MVLLLRLWREMMNRMTAAVKDFLERISYARGIEL